MSAPMFPISYRDTSNFELPTNKPTKSTPTASSATASQPSQSRRKPLVVVTKKEREAQQHQQRQQSKQQPPSKHPLKSSHPIESKEDHEEEDEEDGEDDDDEDDEYEDGESEDIDYNEDEENIFDMAESAFADGKQQQAAKNQSSQISSIPSNPSQPPRHHPVVVTKQERAARAAAASQLGDQPPKLNKKAARAQKRRERKLAAKAEAQKLRVGTTSFLPDSENQKQPKQKGPKKASREEQPHGQPQSQPKHAHPTHSHSQALKPPHQNQHNNKNDHNNNQHNHNHQHVAPNGQPFAPRGRPFFPEHLSPAILQAGLKQGVYLQGILRIVGSNAFVTVNGLQRDVFIEGRKNRNRAFDGDIVCVQIVGHEKSLKSDHEAPPKKKNNKSDKHNSRQGKMAHLEASLENLILKSEFEEDKKIAAEQNKKLKQAKKIDDSEEDTVTPSPIGPSALLTELAASGPDIQHKGVVLGIVTPKFPILNVPGLLKPFSDHLALFVPLDKKTPFAMLPERSWPQDFIKPYRQYLQEQAKKKADKKSALKLRKQQGNFPDSKQNSSDIVVKSSPEPTSASSMERQSSNDSKDDQDDANEVDVDAMTAAADPSTSVTLDPHVYVATYQQWLPYDRQPFCFIKSNLGLSGNIITETEALLVSAGVDYDHDGQFPPSVLNEVASYSQASSNSSGGWQIPETEIAQRRDLRDQTQWRIVSIDPTTARDLDDAIHIKDLGNDVIEIGVHIADVSYFVKPGTQLDAEAKHRATTIYLVQKAIPMLPPILCEQLCSLNPNVDRLSYSCIFYLSKSTGKLLDQTKYKPWFGRTVIRTCCRLNYETAQSLMEYDRSTLNGRAVTEADLTGDLKTAMSVGHPYRPVDVVSIDQLMLDMQLLHRVSMRRRADRFEVGSLTLSNVKLQFQLDQDKNPIGFYSYVVRDSNRVVEECMLLANMLVAHQCVAFCKQVALLRRHPPPNEKSMAKVSQSCQELGFNIDAHTAGALQKSLDAYEGLMVGKTHGINDAVIIDGKVPIRQVLEPLVTKPMQLARYFCVGTLIDSPDEWRHYALHFSEYTHFTSPIRRYADVIVHRVLSYSLELEAWAAAGSSSKSRPRAPPSLSPDEVVGIAENCNTRKANSKKAQEASSKVYLCDYLLRKHADVPLSSSAVITDMFSVMNHADPSFDILIPHLGIEKKIHLNDLLKQGKILAGEIEPKDPPEITKTQQQQSGNNKNGGKANNQPSKQPIGVSASSPPIPDSAAAPSTAPVLKSAKKLHITWLDGTKNVYSIFDGIDVELIVRQGPPMDVDGFIISPTVAEERRQGRGSNTTTTSSTSSPKITSPPITPVDLSVEPPEIID